MLFNEYQLKAIRGALFIRAQSMGDISKQHTQEAIIAYESTQSAMAVIDGLMRGDMVAMPWSLDDVYHLCEDEEGNTKISITDAEARRVLAAAIEYHDAEEGINWNVLQYHLDVVLSERDEDPNGGDGQDD